MIQYFVAFYVRSVDNKLKILLIQDFLFYGSFRDR